MPGIRYEDIDKVNAALEPFIREIEMELCDVQVDDPKAGYLAIGGRNIVACQGNRICQKANTDTTGLSRRLEKLIYPSAYHLKTVIAGCPNDCAKASMSDFGIIGVARMRFTAERCIGCGACVKALCAPRRGVPVIKERQSHKGRVALYRMRRMCSGVSRPRLATWPTGLSAGSPGRKPVKNATGRESFP